MSLWVRSIPFLSQNISPDKYMGMESFQSSQFVRNLDEKMLKSKGVCRFFPEAPLAAGKRTRSLCLPCLQVWETSSWISLFIMIRIRNNLQKEHCGQPPWHRPGLRHSPVPSKDMLLMYSNYGFITLIPKCPPALSLWLPLCARAAPTLCFAVMSWTKSAGFLRLGELRCCRHV